MSTSPFNNSSGANGAHGAARPILDEKMEQVRQLLFGEFERQTEFRVKALEARIREMEVDLYRRLDALDARMAALSGEMDASQRSSQEEIAAGLQELAERVRRFSNS